MEELRSNLSPAKVEDARQRMLAEQSKLGRR